MRIRVRLLEKCDRRLAFVKLLKEYGDIGLKEAEDNVLISHNILNKILKLAFDKLSNDDVIEIIDEISKEFNFDEI